MLGIISEKNSKKKKLKFKNQQNYCYYNLFKQYIQNYIKYLKTQLPNHVINKTLNMLNSITFASFVIKK